MFKSSLSSKGQVTIPKEIREFLQLETGNTILFKIDSNKVFVEKENKEIKCPGCDGKGVFLPQDLPCFVCDQTTLITESSPIIPFIMLLLLPARKHGVGISIIQESMDVDGKLCLLPCPKLELRSDKYPSTILDKVSDYFQMKIIEEYTPRSISTSEYFMIPSDQILDEILALLKLSESKKQVQEWFRYERTNFGN